MRLSTAIRLGSLAIQNPQAGMIRTCAIGMACEAIGKQQGNYNYQVVAEQWPWTSLFADTRNNYYVTLVWHKFDTQVCTGQMTLEALCDQVRAWEDELESRGINVEQVTMAAELTEPASPTQSVRSNALSVMNGQTESADRAAELDVVK